MSRRFWYITFSAALFPVLGFFAVLYAREWRERDYKRQVAQLPAIVVRQMTLEEKVGQLFHIGMTGKVARGRVLRDIQKYHVGGIIQFGKNFSGAARVKAMNQALQKAAIASSDIPLFISTDQEGGRVYRIGPDGATQFPGAMAIGQAADERMAREIGFATGYELRKLGINLVLAPVLDVNNNPANPVINTRSLGSKPELVAELGVAYQAGMREALSTATIKHFPGHGDTSVDSHLDLPRISRNLIQLEQVELLPFRRAIEDDAEMLMTAHILFPSLDAKYPATLSPYILKKLLRQDLGYKGLIITDAMEMHAIARRYGQAEAAIKAFDAGADIILLMSTGRIMDRMYTGMLQAFRSGRLQKTDLDRAVERQIALKLRKNLFKRWQSNHARQVPARLQQEWNLKQTDARSQYININKFYKSRNTSLNREVSRKSIVSLRKPFPGIRKSEMDHVYIITRDGVMRDEAIIRGIAPEHIITLRSAHDIKRTLAVGAADKIWLIEINSRQLRAWNGLVARLNARGGHSARVIGLHVSNPFIRLLVPIKGALLTSFSPTEESRRALIYRALHNKEIKQADLVLPGQ